MRRTGSSLTGRCVPKQHERPSGRGLLRGRKDPRGRHRDAASAAPRNLVLSKHGSQVSGSPFLSHFIAPLSHQNAPSGRFCHLSTGCLCLILSLDILWLGVGTGQFASSCLLTNYERMCTNLLVFERGLARWRADPSDFEGGSARTSTQLFDLEKDLEEHVLNPWIDNLVFPQQACRTRSLEKRRNVSIFILYLFEDAD